MLGCTSAGIAHGRWRIIALHGTDARADVGAVLAILTQRLGGRLSARVEVRARVMIHSGSNFNLTNKTEASAVALVVKPKPGPQM